MALLDILGGGILEGASKIIGQFKEDPTKKAELKAAVDASKAEFELISLKLEKEIEKVIEERAGAIALAQIKLNEADARGTVFQSSWRPLIGYICGAGLLYEVLLRPILNFAAQFTSYTAKAESLDMGTLLTLLTGMLGLGAMRMTEKLQRKV